MLSNYYVFMLNLRDVCKDTHFIEFKASSLHCDENSEEKYYHYGISILG